MINSQSSFLKQKHYHMNSNILDKSNMANPTRSFGINHPMH